MESSKYEVIHAPILNTVCRSRYCLYGPNTVGCFTIEFIFSLNLLKVICLDISFIYNAFLAATEQLYNSLCLSVGRSVGLSVGLSVGRSNFFHDDVNRIEAKPLKIESSNLECSLI